MSHTIVEIKKPCQENLNNMTPNAEGKFCKVCQTSVIDFTNKTPEEISMHLLQTHSQKGCGIFSSEMVKTNDWQDRSIAFLQYHKLNYIALLLTGILLLTGCRTTRTIGAYSAIPKKQMKHHAMTITTKENASAIS